MENDTFCPRGLLQSVCKETKRRQQSIKCVAAAEERGYEV